MKIFFILSWLVPLAASASPLSHTKWVDESASKCPTAIFFGVKKYIFMNQCYARGSDGVVEKGIYSVTGKTLILSNRRFTATGNFVFVPRAVNRLRIISLSEDRFVLNIGGKQWTFRRVTRGHPGKPLNKEMNKPKKKAINYSPSGLDAADARVSF